MTKFNIEDFKSKNDDRYERHLQTLRLQSKHTTSIEKAVIDALKNINQNNTRSFVIYGEPQSGKTEMMIGLTAKLLDEGHKIIIHLLNDSVDLLDQNIRRFRKSGLSPSPKLYKEVLDPEVKIDDNEFIIFSKKNASDLKKLIDKLGDAKGRVIIDDEADYASPNSKINRGEKTQINKLIETLLHSDGIYIGVTATPARLDLNNTFENDHEKWVDFPPHPKYTGQDIFFPISSKDKGFGFQLHLLSDTQDNQNNIKEALFRFLVNTAFLNLFKNKEEQSYSILIHTSGNRADHKSDKSVVETVLAELSNEKSPNYEKHIQSIWQLAKKRFPAKQDKITTYIAKNKSRAAIVLLNSDRNNPNLDEAANPVSLFTIVIGGNIVSRGVTFNNLLSMFFTRDVRHRLQQDTYIQRARMFGARGDYLSYFELTIPNDLYVDWHRCFVFHRLAITAVREGMRAPVWLSDKRISPASSTSIDHGTVSFDKGEMSFALIDFDSLKMNLYNKIIESNKTSPSKISEIKDLLGPDVIPKYLEQYILSTQINGADSIAVHPASSISRYTDGDDINKDKIERVKGFFGRSQMKKSKYPKAVHHLKIFFNINQKARLFYKFDGSIQFIQNLKSKIEQGH